MRMHAEVWKMKKVSEYVRKGLREEVTAIEMLPHNYNIIDKLTIHNPVEIVSEWLLEEVWYRVRLLLLLALCVAQGVASDTILLLNFFHSCPGVNLEYMIQYMNNKTRTRTGIICVVYYDCNEFSSKSGQKKPLKVVLIFLFLREYFIDKQNIHTLHMHLSGR